MRHFALSAVVWVVLVACGDTETHRASTYLEAQPATVDFGSTSPGSTVSRSLSLHNSGSGMVNVASVLLAGDAAAQFAVSGVAPQQVGPGASAEITILYVPSAAGSHNARLLVRSDADNAPELAVSLTGVADPCTGATCDQPPGQCHAPVGMCEAGTCRYALRTDGTSCDDGNPCTESDVCTAGSCAGAPLECNTPPSGACSSTSTFTEYEPTGTCSQGSCTYASTELTCAGGCANDVCSDDPCNNVVCDLPPPAACADADTLRTYDVVGTCAAGLCSYAYVDTDCTAPANALATCTDGACGFTCDSGYDLCNGACVANAITEACDGADNDCDGFVDEGCGNGSCSVPLKFNPEGGYVTGQMSGSSTTSGPCGGSNGVERVWSWTAPRSGQVVIQNHTDYWPASVYIREGSCSGTSLGCTYHGGTWPNMTVTANVTAGTTYFIVVDSWYTGSIIISYGLSVTPPP